MKTLNVTVTDRVVINNKTDIGSGNVNTVKCVFSLPSSFSGLIGIASFKKGNSVYTRTIQNNECYVPKEVLESKGYVWLGVYGYVLNNDELVLRESPIIDGFPVDEGSYMGEGQSEEDSGATDYEVFIAAMEQIKEETQAIIDNFTAEDVVFEDGETFQDKLEAGDFTGPKGDTGDTGERGPSGIAVQEEEPGEEVDIWVDTDEEGETLDLSMFVQDQNYVHTDNNYINEDKELVDSLKETRETIYATGKDYAEYFMWNDENPNNEDRSCRFVAIQNGTRNIKIANDTDNILGVTTSRPSFVGNAQDEYINDNKYDVVGIIGIIEVIDDGNCVVGGYAMPNNEGIAVPSTNGIGYKIVERLGNNKIEITLVNDSDMISRIKTDIEELYDQIPEGTANGTTIHLTDSSDLQLKNVEIQGNSTQDETPTPDNEVLVNNVTGDVVVTVDNSDNTENQSITVPLGDLELVKVPAGVKDRIYKSNNKWWLEKNIGSTILNGTEIWNIFNYGSAHINTTMFVTNSLRNQTKKTAGVYLEMLSTRFVCKNNTATTLNTDGSWIMHDSTPNLFVCIENAKATTVQEFKDWLSENNTLVYFLLETPITTEITDTALINALDQLLELRTYKHITNVENDKDAYLDITYNKDLSSIHDDYNPLRNKPSINGVQLVGNKTAANLGLANASDLSNHNISSSAHQDIRNSIPTKNSDLDNDTNYQSGTQVDTSINNHNVSDLAHTDIRQTANEAKAIARGKSESRTFDTTADLISWISDIANKNVLKIGDNLYDKTNGVPDYWISAVLEEPNSDGYYYDISPLDAETPDISNMMTTNTAQMISGNKNFTGELKKNGVDVQKETIEDAENFFNSNTVEGALQELGEIVDFTKNKANDLIWQEGYYGVSDGVIASNAYICSSNYINVKPFDNYKFYNYTEDKSVYEQTNIIAMLADDDNNKIGLVVRRASASQVTMFTADEWTAQYARFMIPAEATRMYLNVYAPVERQNYASSVGVFRVGNLNVNVNVTNSEEFHNLEEKRWTSLGDSITYQNMWQPFLVEKYRVNHVNCGIGGSCLAGNTPNAFWQDVRLNAVKDSDPDALTILGGANDLGDPNIEIGTEAEFAKAIENKDKMTFLGAYSYIIENLLTWKPSLRIVVLGTTWAHMNGADYSQTLTYSDFSNASKKVAEYYGLLFVDLHGNCGFNKFTMEDSPYNIYSNDHIHPNAAGGKMIAEQVDVVFRTMFEFD